MKLVDVAKPRGVGHRNDVESCGRARGSRQQLGVETPSDVTHNNNEWS